MPKCPKCNKEVYFAEKVSSLGKDWHRPCLKCEKCRKTLSPGAHAEHERKPYCHTPCYAALFGPGEIFQENFTIKDFKDADTITSSNTEQNQETASTKDNKKPIRKQEYESTTPDLGSAVSSSTTLSNYAETKGKKRHQADDLLKAFMEMQEKSDDRFYEFEQKRLALESKEEEKRRERKDEQDKRQQYFMLELAKIFTSEK